MCYRDVRRHSAHKEDDVLGVDVEQGVGAQGHPLLDELLLVRGGLAGDGQEHLPVAAQPVTNTAVSTGSTSCYITALVAPLAPVAQLL